MRLRLIALLAIWATAAQADLLYTDADKEIVLLDDLCNSGQPMVRIAYATNLAHTDKANGCWWQGKMGTYIIELERGDGSREQYQLYRDKFKAMAK